MLVILGVVWKGLHRSNNQFINTECTSQQEGECEVVAKAPLSKLIHKNNQMKQSSIPGLIEVGTLVSSISLCRRSAPPVGSVMRVY